MSDPLKIASYNLGWSHIVPAAASGKICSIILSVTGIPIIFSLIHTGSKLFLKGMKDFLMIIQPMTTLLQEEPKYQLKDMLPEMILVLLISFFVTSIAVPIAGTIIFGATLSHLSEQGDVIYLREVAKLDEKLKQTKPNF